MAYVSIPLYKRTIPQRYKLIGLKCKRCGWINFPPKGIYKRCKVSSEFEKVKLSGKGAIYSYTVITAAAAPPEFSKQEKSGGSYVVALIELDEGPRIVAQLVNCKPENVRIGMRVESTIRKIYEDEGVVRYGFKFKPVEESLK